MNATDINVIKASAGTGKTTTLLKRVLARILDDDPDAGESVAARILIITFTVAAADDIRRKLTESIDYALRYVHDPSIGDPHYKIGGNPGPIADLLEDASRFERNVHVLEAARLALPSMQISTIDAFSKRIVDRNADAPTAEGGGNVIAPGYELLADNGMRNALRAEVLDPLMRDWYRKDGPHHGALADLLDEFGGAEGDDALRAEIFALYDVAQAQGSAERWIERIPLLYAEHGTLTDTKPAKGGVSAFTDRLIDDALDELSVLRRGIAAIRAEADAMVTDYDDAQQQAKADGTLKERTGSVRIKKKLFDNGDGGWTKRFWDPVAQWYDRLDDALHNGSWDKIRSIALSMAGNGEIPSDGASVPSTLERPMKVPAGRNPAACLCMIGDDAFAALGLPWRPSELAAPSRSLAVRVKAFNGLMARRFSTRAAEIDALDEVALHRLDTLRDLTMEFAQRYDRRKFEASVAEYADVQRAALHLVADSPVVAAQVAAQWRYAYVDESQDNSPLQNEFVAVLRAAGIEVTMVGDAKQSIYAFRNASPEGFERICASAGDRVEHLRQNFRSNPEIIDFANAVFGAIMDPAIGGTDYAKERLELGSGYVAAEASGKRKVQQSVELLCRVGSGRTDNGSDGPIAGMALRSSGPQQQVDMVVRRIRGLLSESLPADADGRTRPIRPGDIMVLARSKTHFGDLQRALRNAGIDSRVDGVGEYFVKAEIVIALDWLRIIDNPNQDVPLAAVLRSIGFTNDDLAAIRLARSHGPFLSAMHATTKGDGNLATDVSLFLDRLKALREWASWHSIASTLWRLYGLTGWYDYAGTLPQGAQRQSNLRELAAKAEAFEGGQSRGIAAFIDAVSGWADDRDANEEPSTLENDDAVRIMTIHKSKGLQSPVVILMDASDPKINRKTLSKTILHDMLSGSEDAALGTCALKLRDSATMLERTTLQWQWLYDVKDAAATSESLRLLYVALTRAQSKLIMAGTASLSLADPEPDAKGHIDPLTVRFLKSSGYPAAGYPGDVIAKETRTKQDFMTLAIQSVIHVSGGLDAAEGSSEELERNHCGALLRLTVPAVPERMHGGVVRRERIAVDVRLDAVPALSEFTSSVARSQQEAANMRPRRFLTTADRVEPVRVPLGVTASGAERWREELSGNGEEPFLRNGMPKPEFMAERDGTVPSTEIGTAVHAALEVYDWTADGDATRCDETLEHAFDRLVDSGAVRIPIARLALERNREGLLWFVRDSSMAQGIRANANTTLRREAQFAMLITPAALLATLGERRSAEELGLDLSALGQGEAMVVRGIIDGYYVERESKRIILFDYKTDAVRAGESIDEWARRLHDDYFGQQALYARALQEQYGPDYTVTERWLVGLAGKRLIDVSS